MSATARRMIRLWLAVLLLPCLAPPAASAEYSPEAVKAAFLYRFAGYVQWPQSAPDVPFTIAVLDADDVADALAHIVATHTIAGHRAQVRKLKSTRELGDAQLLYIGPGHGYELRSLILPLAQQPILIVTDDDNGLAAGSTLNFRQLERRIAFEASVTAAQRAGLRISSDLLSVALHVEGVRP